MESLTKISGIIIETNYSQEIKNFLEDIQLGFFSNFVKSVNLKHNGNKLNITPYGVNSLFFGTSINSVILMSTDPTFSDVHTLSFKTSCSFSISPFIPK